MAQKLSENETRNKSYLKFLDACKNKTATIKDIIRLGVKMMRQGKIHHHFFGDFSLLNTSQYLTFYSLGGTQDLNHKLTEEEALKVIALFERRISERIPVAYITHETTYLGYKFYVNENVLVPRSVMNNRFKDFLSEIQWENYRVLDLCTGSGCIGITLALLNPNIKVDLADISEKALEVARKNIDNYSLNDRVKCIQSDLFENIHDKYDLIITNPPYVTINEYQKSAEEFKNEPKLALEAGVDGMDIVNKILFQSKNHLNPQGVLIAEVGTTVAKHLKKKYPKVRFKWFKYRRPNVTESFFSMPAVFWCESGDLPVL